MKANELRIGNLALIDGEHTIIKGWMIHLMQIGETSDKKIEPIPLTEEWLVRFGFKKTKNLYYLPMPSIKASIHYEIHNYGNVVTIQSDFGSFIPNDIEHVHQLQNLYFALTGEELKYD